MRAEQATVSTNIRRLREAKGLTQVGLAVAAGVNPSTVARVEAGHKPNLLTLEALARALGVPLTELVSLPAEEPA